MSRGCCDPLKPPLTMETIKGQALGLCAGGSPGAGVSPKGLVRSLVGGQEGAASAAEQRLVQGDLLGDKYVSDLRIF